MTNSCCESVIEQRHWTREPMVWMVIAIPMSAVVVGALLLTLSIKSWDGLVVDDYYQHGKEINRVLARDQIAFDRGIRAVVNVNKQTVGDYVGNAGDSTRDGVTEEGAQTIQSALEVVIQESDANSVREPVLNIRFVHRTRSGFDREAVVQHVGNGLYRGEALSIPLGRWRLQIDAPDWRLTKNIAIPVTQAVTIAPFAP